MDSCTVSQGWLAVEPVPPALSISSIHLGLDLYSHFERMEEEIGKRQVGFKTQIQREKIA